MDIFSKYHVKIRKLNILILPVFDKVHLKCDCLHGSIVNGVGEAILFFFTLSFPPGHKTYKEPRSKLFNRINDSVLSHVIFF